MRATLHDILPEARAAGYAVGAFNFNNLEAAQAIIIAAHELRSPVVLQTSEGALSYAGMHYLAAIAWVAMESTDVPVVFHLDHGKDADLVKLAIKTGYYTSVMYDGSALPFKENIRTTRAIVQLAHKRGITVEAELGPIPGKEDLVDVQARDAFYTDPDQAAAFVHATGCDALAVSIGTAHGAYKHSASTGTLDIKRLTAIADAVSVPLVLHGASHVDEKMLVRLHAQCEKIGDCTRIEGAAGIADADIKKAVKHGIAKVNVDTDLRLAFTVGVRESMMNNHSEIDPRKVLGPARELMMKTVKAKMKLLGCAGKA